MGKDKKSADKGAGAGRRHADQQARAEARAQGQRRSARRQPASPDFLDTLHNYVHNRTGHERRAWLDNHGLRGASPRQQPIYSLLPAAMRDGYERRLEADRQARIQQQQAAAAAEVVSRYQVTNTSVDEDQDQDQDQDDKESKGKGNDGEGSSCR
ncbi:hypothetical protein EsDP_00003029 [Epichloe bromicola]|uniref:Uncharacterized protein n=1 Tax=Epichloe bromicola TaxID=79588 RepID=A0ABQ0CML1_9HYPO